MQAPKALGVPSLYQVLFQHSWILYEQNMCGSWNMGILLDSRMGALLHDEPHLETQPLCQGLFPLALFLYFIWSSA